MNFEVVVSKKSHRNVQKFWKAMEIFLKNPHLINRRISTCINLLTTKIRCELKQIIDTVSKVENLSKIFERDWESNEILSILNIANECSSEVFSFNPLLENYRDTYLVVNKYLPRNVKFSPGIEFVIIDKKLNSICCYHRSIDCEKRSLGFLHPYIISLNHENIFAISIEKTNFNSFDPSLVWLREKFFPCVLKWIENDRPNEDVLVDGSLNLVCSEKYTNLYNKLKLKYGQEMVKKWPECTDPNKFVYEDVAIAAYLILLWEDERINDNDEKQSFIDLGCGNGLLVHILTSEGHSGTGIDLRKRQIWDIYPPTTRLVEQTIVPSSSSLFPKIDWLIGNHSDELTPWIPVIAARSSYHCKFFLLPCCPHEFDGRKFQRESAIKSQYFEYMKYVKSVCEGCGFKTDIDKLRIPSTKRICLVGRDRIYPREMMPIRDKLIDEIINARSLKGKEISAKERKNNSTESQWSTDFKPRESVERVRNCTKVDRAVIDEIINVVTRQLLHKVRNIERNGGGTWNAGGQIELAEIAKILAPETLKKLRNECGGLQTLLRNNSHIFRVSDGCVHFRIPGTAITSNKNKKNSKNFRTKVKACWFHENHPDGCPVTDELCNFKH
ncbi:probable tRNA (uracil-O(2)-)-methyltransferase isoform X1 [Venturia canescens]|uniref:probable tRNA (uracil-O(2)-)-methyltransferase isoform X1 n=1 Tax=Venturia canescens TaxID=32260 RepID=UPI001C9D1B5A|nr:probable tRNA (uracil-O(2)-)-methyltransferase isoform X1 [Venturia canescens]